MSMADRDGVIWYDGELVQWRDATTHVLTHTLHYGMGVFEGVRAYDTPQGTAIFRLQAHTDRLFDSAHREHADPVQPRRDQRGDPRRRAREQPGKRLYPPDGVLRKRRHGPAPAA